LTVAILKASSEGAFACFRAMDYDDDVDGASSSKWKLCWARWVERIFRWPVFFPPKIWLSEDLAKEKSASYALSRAVKWIVTIVGACFALTGIIIMYRSFNDFCVVRLNAFVLVATILVVGWTIAFFVLLKTLTQAARIVFVSFVWL
jgi:hypothetical protein